MRRPYGHNENSIHIHERGSQFDILTGVPGTFMFVSPVPGSVFYPDIIWYRKNTRALQKNDRPADLSGGLPSQQG